MADSVKLIGAWPSPFVARARIALGLKKVEYEYLQEKFGEKSELLLKSNPVYKKIPVLIHNDKPICESLIIVQYIDEVWPADGAGAILPADPYDRALHRFWCVYIDDKIMADSVKLIGGWSSPFVIRARIALALKKLEYEFLQLKVGDKSELLCKSNPVYKKIPVLIHNDRPICESMIIVQYIDQVWPADGAGAILPADPYDRALHRFWAVYIDDKWYPLLKGISLAQTEETKAEKVEGVLTGLKLLEDAFEKLSKGKAFFGGDSIGYLDIALGCFVGWLGMCEQLDGVKLLDEEKTPLLVGWADRFSEHEVAKEVNPGADKMVEFAKEIQFPAKWKVAAPAK